MCHAKTSSITPQNGKNQFYKSVQNWRFFLSHIFSFWKKNVKLLKKTKKQKRYPALNRIMKKKRRTLQSLTLISKLEIKLVGGILTIVQGCLLITILVQKKKENRSVIIYTIQNDQIQQAMEHDRQNAGVSKIIVKDCMTLRTPFYIENYFKICFLLFPQIWWSIIQYFYFSRESINSGEKGNLSPITITSFLSFGPVFESLWRNLLRFELAYLFHYTVPYKFRTIDNS